MVSSSGVQIATAIQSAAKEMTRRIIARFWNTRFNINQYRLIPRAIFTTEDVMVVHTAIEDAPSHVQGRT